MKRILLMGADPNNSRDGCIVLGVHTILKKKYGEYDFDYIFIDDHNLMKRENFFAEKEYDLLVYAGTPLYWSHFWNTPKYKNMQMIRGTHKDSKFVVMGGGACMNLDRVDTSFMMDAKTRSKLQEAFGNSINIVRDSKAADLLDNAGVENEFLPCPAYFIEVLQDVNKEGPSLIFYDPRKGISQDDWKGPEHAEKFARYAAEFRDFYHNKDAKVYVASDDDIDGCLEIGLSVPTVLRTPADALEMVKRSTFLLSGRVHNAIPAEANDVLTVLVAVDSRAYTFFDFGGHVIFPDGSEPLNTNQISKEAALTKYMELLP